MGRMTLILGGSASQDHADNTKYDKAFIIGDFKRSVTTIKPSGNQWKAIGNYAQYDEKHQYIPIALYITLRQGGRAGEAREKYLTNKALNQFN